jgi:hypothetical protein
MAGVTRSFLDHVQHDEPEVREVDAPFLPPRVWLARGRGERSGCDDRVRPLDLVPVKAEHAVGRLTGPYLPPGVRPRREEVKRLTTDDATEPIVLVGQGQVLNHAQACPSGRQHRPPQLLVGQALQDAKHMVALLVEEIPQQLGLFVHRPLTLVSRRARADCRQLS